MGSAAAIFEILGTAAPTRTKTASIGNSREAVNRFQRLSGSRVATVDASLAGASAIALTQTASQCRSGPSPPIGKICANNGWRTRRSNACPIQKSWTKMYRPTSPHGAVARALFLLGLHVGDRVVPGLRLFADRFFFASEKDILDLGLEGDAGWWRESLVQFPVESVSAKQPVVRGRVVEKVLSHGDALVRSRRDQISPLKGIRVED